MLTANRADSETNTALDALACSQSLYRSGSEAQTGADTLAQMTGFIRGDAETNATSGSLNAVYSSGNMQYSVSPTESLSFSDGLMGGGTFDRTALETEVAFVQLHLLHNGVPVPDPVLPPTGLAVLAH
jgi:hypothetical protein